MPETLSQEINKSGLLSSFISKKEINFPIIRSFDDLSSQMHNQFESSLLVQYPLLSKLKKFLIENGAFGALVTGSGSAVFGVFNKKNTQNQAYKDFHQFHNEILG